MDQKLSQQTLAQRLADAATKVAVGAEYVHYKQNRYTVLSLALLEATLEPCVVYQALYGERLVFIRPLTDWLAKVEYQGKKVTRFTKI